MPAVVPIFPHLCVVITVHHFLHRRIYTKIPSARKRYNSVDHFYILQNTRQVPKFITIISLDVLLYARKIKLKITISVYSFVQEINSTVREHSELQAICYRYKLMDLTILMGFGEADNINPDFVTNFGV